MTDKWENVACVEMVDMAGDLAVMLTYELTEAAYRQSTGSCYKLE